MKKQIRYNADKKMEETISTIEKVKSKSCGNALTFAIVFSNFEDMEAERRVINIGCRCRIKSCFYVKACETEKDCSGEEAETPFCEKGTYYYSDDKDSKTRFIVLEPHHIHSNGNKNSKKSSFAFSQRQLEWFSDVLQDVPEGYTVALFSCFPISENQNNIRGLHIAFGILNAFIDGKTYVGESLECDDVKNNISIYTTFQKKGNVVGWFCCGEKENKITSYSASMGKKLRFKLVSVSDMDEYREYSQREAIADFVIADNESGEVYIARMGRGGDRSYNFLVDYI